MTEASAKPRGENCDAAYGHLSPQTRPDTQRAVEDLVRELEGYSIELQRHCAEDWNQCSAVLVQCLSSVSEEQAQGQKGRHPPRSINGNATCRSSNKNYLKPL